MKQLCTVILGSQSPRRKALLAQWGIDLVCKTPKESHANLPSSPADYVMALAARKMQSIEVPDGACAITADTIVHMGETILEKPTSREQARKMILALENKKHTVSTAFVVKGAQSVSQVVHTDVWMQSVSNAWLETYLDQASFMDKAGAYGIQEHAGAWIDRVEGSITNVIGLPVHEVLQALQKVGAIAL